MTHASNESRCRSLTALERRAFEVQHFLMYERTSKHGDFTKEVRSVVCFDRSTECADSVSHELVEKRELVLDRALRDY